MPIKINMKNQRIKRKSVFIGIIAAILIICLFLIRSLFDNDQQIRQYFDGWFLIGEIALILFITWLTEKK